MNINYLIKSNLIAVLFLLLSTSCKDAHEENIEKSNIATEKSIENEVEQPLIEPTDDSQNYDYVEENDDYVKKQLIEDEKSRRKNELKILSDFKKKVNSAITDEYGLIQDHTIIKEFGKEIEVGTTGVNRHVYDYNGRKRWNSFEFKISLREVINNLKINGVLQSQIKTFEQVYGVEHKFYWGTFVDDGKGLFETFDPETELTSNRNKIFTTLSRRFVHREEEPDTEWKQAYTVLIKNSGILKINSYDEFIKYYNANQKSPLNKDDESEQEEIVEDNAL